MSIEVLTATRMLVLRDIRSRFAGDGLGFAWAFLTPLGWLMAVVLFYSLIDRRLPIHTDMLSFVLSGMLPYAVFRYTLNAILRGEARHRHAYFLEGTNEQSVMMAAALVELITYGLLFLFLFLGNRLLYEVGEIASWFPIISGFLTAWLLGIGSGYFFLVLGRFHPSVVRLVPILVRPLFWLSGIFYTATEVLPFLYDYLQYNPLFTSIEVVREGLFPGYQSPLADLGYSYSVPVLILLFSLLLNRIALGREEALC